MDLPEKVGLLRIYIGESDKHGRHPLYEVIVSEARKRGLAGATVVKGFSGYGKNSRYHTASVLRLSEDSPLVVEIANEMEKIEAFLPDLDKIVTNGLVTLGDIRVKAYRNNRGRYRDAESNQ